MAIDTRNKRAACLSGRWGQARVFPAPDGTIAAGDRRAALGFYPYAVASGPFDTRNKRAACLSGRWGQARVFPAPDGTIAAGDRRAALGHYPYETEGTTVVPSPAVSTWVVNDPSISGGGVATPAPAISIWVVNDPVVNGTVTPASAISTWVVNSPLINITATPSPAVATWVANDPSIGGVGTPDPAVASWVVNAPSVNGLVIPESAVSAWFTLDPAQSVGPVVVTPEPATSLWVLPVTAGLVNPATLTGYLTTASSLNGSTRDKIILIRNSTNVVRLFHFRNSETNEYPTDAECTLFLRDSAGVMVPGSSSAMSYVEMTTGRKSYYRGVVSATLTIPLRCTVVVRAELLGVVREFAVPADVR